MMTIMHIFFSGIGGTGIGPLALIAKQAGYEVSGSDKQASQYTTYLQKHGIQLYIEQTKEAIAKMHQTKPIDWFVYTSALPLENPHHPELLYIHELGIRHSKRDDFLQYFLTEKKLKLIAFAGTHGKTSSTAMAVWTAKQLGVPISYSVGAKISFGDMGHYDPSSKYFLYECDEFDKNFLAYQPYISVLTKVDWDHHEQYPTRKNYIDAFRQFVSQSKNVIAHKSELKYLSIESKNNVHEIDESLLPLLKIKGAHNRSNAAGVATAMAMIQRTNDYESIIRALNAYPGSNRRFEKLTDNIYSDYAHTPEEIAATLQLAKEYGKSIVVVYEPLTNRRQHFMRDAYKDVFQQLDALYWLPSYLAREDPELDIIHPEQFIAQLPESAHAHTAKLNDELKSTIIQASNSGALVLLLAGGGGGSLDEWARKAFVKR